MSLTERYAVEMREMNDIEEGRLWDEVHSTNSISIVQPAQSVGRQMDYDIATKIFHLPVVSKLVYNSGEEVFFTDAPYFSTDITEAMKILAFLQAKNFMWSVNGSSEGGYWCVLYPPVGDYAETELCATPEEAICRAALQLTLELIN